MKNHIIDATITAESITTMTTAVTTLSTEVSEFGIHLDDAQRKHSQKMGTRNETFAREMLDFAAQYPSMIPASIGVADLQRDLVAREQITPILFQVEALARTLRDTHAALGIDLYNGTRAMYKTVKPLAAINGLQDVIGRIGLRFAAQGKRKTEPAPETTPPTQG